MSGNLNISSQSMSVFFQIGSKSDREMKMNKIIVIINLLIEFKVCLMRK